MKNIADVLPKMRLSRYQLWFVLGAIAGALVLISISSGTRPFDIVASVFALASIELVLPDMATTLVLDASTTVELHAFFRWLTIVALVGTVARVLFHGRFQPSAVAEKSIGLIRGATLPSLWLLLMLTIQLAPRPIRLRGEVDWVLPVVVATGVVVATLATFAWLTREGQCGLLRDHSWWRVSVWSSPWWRS